MLGNHCLKVWCSTQGATALSSGEAEYYSMVEGGIKALGGMSVGRELGVKECAGGLVMGVDECGEIIGQQAGSWEGEVHGGAVVLVTGTGPSGAHQIEEGRG